MSVKNQNERIIFGLKVKQLRQQRGLSFAELSQASGLSISYLNEIEKGKKYPKDDKIHTLSKTLGVSYRQLTSDELSKGMEPIQDLLQSNFLHELPLDLFGIELSKVVEIIANAPAKVSAFISTLLELSRNYALREENFYFAALRSYLELHQNYFEEIELAVDRLVDRFDLSLDRPIPVDRLRALLEEHFGYTILEKGLDPYPELQHLRSVFIPKSKKLLLNSDLTPMQTAFQFGKELGFQFLELKERANTSSILRGRVFEEVLNHSRAIYFSVALHIPRQKIVADLEQFFQLEKWDGRVFAAIMEKYQATPEMFFHRLTNVLPRFFGLHKLFFLRFLHAPANDRFEIDKELHLERKHHPHGNGLSEHYCRRWVSITLLRELHRQMNVQSARQTIVGIQRSQYIGTEDEYLCLTLARPAYPAPDRNVSVTLGLLINSELRARVRFLQDPAISVRQVNNTCERCSVEDCTERAAPPVVVQRRENYRRIRKRLEGLE